MRPSQMRHITKKISSPETKKETWVKKHSRMHVFRTEYDVLYSSSPLPRLPLTPTKYRSGIMR